MQIDLRFHQKLYHALRSDVYAADDRIYKIFKRSGDENFNLRTTTVFEAQCDAYERAAKDAFMRRHTPEYYGQVAITGVIDHDGTDISGIYNPNACYSLEQLHGPEEKVNADAILTAYPYVTDACRYFVARGVETNDASVFSFDDIESFKLIDIMTRNF
jgi:hypothetical protein